MSLAATVGRVSELCNCRWANERGVHGACVLPVTSREPAPLSARPPPRPPRRHEARASPHHRELRTSSAFLKMADGLCTGDAARRKNAIEGQQGVKEKLNRCCREDKTTECARKNGFCVGVIGGDDDGLCPKQQQQHDEEGFLAVEMPAEDDCRKKRCVDRYDSSESSDRYVWVC